MHAQYSIVSNQNAHEHQDRVHNDKLTHSCLDSMIHSNREGLTCPLRGAALESRVNYIKLP
ncbi:hypothetical protein D8674_027308 [Pyrus ussuriensis x Pyrus communis]|uniref:Uncharacterized protein n=1 Tax=Pyrus ussuriensis x Pyrus communis TaxID=2448454 RepID=A0A5N5IPA2_9ROSA|nr:hypothetical protein D8674_027308 [Pyrus ussuriensis x Pyrus communis]